MIIKGGARSSGGFFAYHLMKAEENERVEVKEMRGLLADTVPEAFQEMRMVAAGTRAENYFYHASINPREDEHLTPEQWDIAVDRLEQNLGLSDHARFQVEHEKNGRTHRHIVWSRVDLATMTVTPASGNYLAHDQTRLELEREFSHEPTSPTPQPSLRKSREFADWENFRAAESGIDPKEMKAEITTLWQQSDGGRAFQAALEEKGYLLAKGDRRDFVLIDPEGDVHSLARRIDGAKAADLRAKMGDLDRDSLMSAKEASAWMRTKEGEAETSGSSAARVLPQEQAQEITSHNPKLAVLEKLAQEPPVHTELDPRAAWFAENLPDTYPTATSLSDHAATIEHDMRANDGELPFTQGQTWEMWADHAWHYLEERRSTIPEKVHELSPELQERLDHLTDTVTHVKDRLSTYWQDFIKEGREREPPDDLTHQEPELER